jgi:hypothetical protein
MHVKGGNWYSFRGTAANFNIPMCKASNCTIVEVEELLEVGEIPPEQVRGVITEKLNFSLMLFLTSSKFNNNSNRSMCHQFIAIGSLLVVKITKNHLKS